LWNRRWKQVWRRCCWRQLNCAYCSTTPQYGIYSILSCSLNPSGAFVNIHGCWRWRRYEFIQCAYLCQTKMWRWQEAGKCLVVIVIFIVFTIVLLYDSQATGYLFMIMGALEALLNYDKVQSLMDCNLDDWMYNSRHKFRCSLPDGLDHY